MNLIGSVVEAERPAERERRIRRKAHRAKHLNGAVHNPCLKPSSDNFDRGYFGPRRFVARAIHDPGDGVFQGDTKGYLRDRLHEGFRS